MYQSICRSIIRMASSSDAGDANTSRGLQRQATTDLSFFTPSSVSFNPKPYFPHPGHVPNRTKSSSSSSLQRISIFAHVYDSEARYLNDTIPKIERSLLRHSSLHTFHTKLRVLSNSEEFFVDTETEIKESFKAISSRLRVLVVVVLEWYASSRWREDAFKVRVARYVTSHLPPKFMLRKLPQRNC